MRKTAVYHDPLFLAHETGREHLESPQRLRALYQDLLMAEVAAKLIYPTFTKASAATVKLAHTAELVQKVAATAAHPACYLDADTRTSQASYQAALLAAGAVIDGIRRLASNEIDNAFCLVRPPGHHAERNRAMGFCLFNSIAIGARWALKHLGLERILIIDWDLHHGNGTQRSFYRSNKVLYCSIHQYPFYPGSGALPETGEGRGRGYTVNVPLSGGHGDEHYARIFNELIVPLGRCFRPQLILVSSGFDLMAGDPVGAMQVTPAGLAYMTRVLQELAMECCQGRLLFTLEGGYDLDNMQAGTRAVLSELYGAPLSASWPVALSAQDSDRLRASRVPAAALDQALLWMKNSWSW